MGGRQLGLDMLQNVLERTDVQRPEPRRVHIGEVLRDGGLPDRQPFCLLCGQAEKGERSHEGLNRSMSWIPICGGSLAPGCFRTRASEAAITGPLSYPASHQRGRSRAVG